MSLLHELHGARERLPGHVIFIPIYECVCNGSAMNAGYHICGQLGLSLNVNINQSVIPLHANKAEGKRIILSPYS